MIRARSQSELASVIIGILAVVIAGLTGIYALLTMKPPKPANVPALMDARSQIQRETTQAKARQAAVDAKVAARTWTGTVDQVSATSLAKASALAKVRNVTLTTFRPQKQLEVNGLTQLPFLILVDGAFPSVMQFVKDLERPDTKLAVSLVQMSSADEASDRVSATIGVAAYLHPPKKGVNVGSTK